MRTTGIMKGVFAAVMLIFCGMICWYAINTNDLQTQKIKLEQDLETSLGRERKQQAEYDAVMQELPVQKAALEELQPESDAAKELSDAMKAERKQLRADVAELKEAAEAPEDLEPALNDVYTALNEAASAIEGQSQRLNAMSAEVETVLKLLKETSPIR